MAQYDELVSVLRELLTNRFSPLPRYVNALLGDGQGNVVPPDRPDMSYARFTKESTSYFEVFNVTVPKVHNWPVKIGEVPWNPGLTQVVGTNWSAFEQSGWGDVLGDTSPHGPTHEYPDGSPGADVVNIHTRAIVPGRAFLTNAAPATVYVNALEYGTTGTLWGGLPGVNLQPLMSSMVTGTMRYAGVYLDSTTNSLGIVTGATTVFTSAFDPPRVSFPATGAIPIARVRVYGGQSSLAEVDVKDARRLFGQGGGGASFNDAEGDPAAVGPTAADGTSAFAARRDHAHTIDITAFTAETTADDTDVLLIYDAGAAANRKMTRANVLGSIIRPTIVDAKGDILAATAADTITRLPVSGNNGYVLTEDNGEATGLKWSAAGSGWPYPKVHTVASSGADFTSVATAIADAGVAAGDIIEVGENVTETNMAVNKAVTIRGVGQGVTITVTTGSSLGAGNIAGAYITAAATLENITVVSSNNGETTNHGIYCDANATLRNVIASATGSTNRRGITVNTGRTVEIYECQASATGGGGENTGLLVSGTANVYGGRFSGDDYDLYVSSSSTANLYNSPKLTGTIYNGGTITGTYQDSNGDAHASGDDFGLFNRNINLGQVPAEHWRWGASTLAWTGWATYAGHITPSNVSIAGSQLLASDASSTGRFYYYRPYINAQTTLQALCTCGVAAEAGVQVDDGVDGGGPTNVGANNFVRFFVEWPTAATNPNLAREYRAGGGGVTKHTYLSLPPTDLVGIRLIYGIGTRWSSWSAYVYVACRNVYNSSFSFSFLASLASQTWTPARHGIYGQTTVANRATVWDWFDE